MTDARSRLVVSDSDNGWQVLVYERPRCQGESFVIADGLTEEDADAIAEEYADKIERRAFH